MGKHLTPIEKEFLIRAFRSNPNAKIWLGDKLVEGKLHYLMID